MSDDVPTALWPLWLKISCVVVFLAVMVGLKYGLQAAFEYSRSAGAIACIGVMAACFLIAWRIDRRGKAEQD